MKGMILAAGLGKRLGALTAAIPKALIQIAGRPMISHIIDRFIDAGIDEIIVNVHHHADQLSDFLKKQRNPSLRLEISVEETLLDTGGGIKRVSWFFDDGRPFLVHNVDVISQTDLNQLLAFHAEFPETLATLAVSERRSSRYLLFDNDSRLRGWYSQRDKRDRLIGRGEEKNLQRFAFQGIHVLSPQIFEFFPAIDRFPILDAYLDLAENGKTVRGCKTAPDFWVDAGKSEGLEMAETYLSSWGRREKQF